MSAKTYQEQVAALEETRAAKSARMAEIMQKGMEDGRSTDAAEQEEFDTLESEVDALDGDIKRLKTLEKLNLRTAKPVNGTTEKAASESRETHKSAVLVKNTQRLDPGIRFARVARCIGLAQGNVMQASAIAENVYRDDDAVVGVLKAAVSAGSVEQSTWGSQLVGDETSVFADFAEFLRPTTILGKFGTNGIPSLRRVPFRTALIGQTTGGSGYWVGEAKAKPLTSFAFSRTTIEPLKVANIAVATMELLRDSSPSAETLLRDQLAAALRERLDIDFIDPDKGASAGVSPASITNGITPLTSGGNDADDVREDLRSIFAEFIANDNAPTTGVWIMSSTTALGLSLMVNALGQREFPNVTMMGGTLEGLPVITSEYIADATDGHFVVLVNASDVFLADDGGISVDVSREASLAMDNAPTMDSHTPTAAQVVSMFQTNSVAFRAERTVNWARRRSSGVRWIQAVNWGQPTA